jgi:hypothetical protein
MLLHISKDYLINNKDDYFQIGLFTINNMINGGFTYVVLVLNVFYLYTYIHITHALIPKGCDRGS